MGTGRLTSGGQISARRARRLIADKISPAKSSGTQKACPAKPSGTQKARIGAGCDQLSGPEPREGVGVAQVRGPCCFTYPFWEA